MMPHWLRTNICRCRGWAVLSSHVNFQSLRSQNLFYFLSKYAYSIHNNLPYITTQAVGCYNNLCKPHGMSGKFVLVIITFAYHSPKLIKELFQP